MLSDGGWKEKRKEVRRGMDRRILCDPIFFFFLHLLLLVGSDLSGSGSLDTVSVHLAGK
jgi:hypothetical protein